MEVPGRLNGRSFKDSVGISSADANEVFCQPCSIDGDHVVAKGYCQNCNEYFCAACLKPHRKQTATRHHVIHEGEHMPIPQLSRLQLDPCSEPCAQHANEIVKFYCSSHDSVGCGDCMVLHHKMCKVDRIQDVSNGYLTSQEYKELVRKLESYLESSDKCKSQVERNRQLFEETCNKALNDLKTFRKEINDYLDKAEAEVVAEVNRKKKADEKKMSNLETDNQSLQNEIKDQLDKLQQRTNKCNDLFIVAKRTKKTMASIDATLREMSKNNQVTHYAFTPAPEVRQIITSNVSFGQLKENPKHNTTRKNVGEMVPQFEGEINVRASDDKLDCRIVAAAVVSPSRVVLADSENRNVKLLDLDHGKIMAKHNFLSEPADITRVNETKVAVAFPAEKKIQFLSIRQDDTISPEKQISLRLDCLKLFCKDDKIVIATPGVIQIINMNGHVIKDIAFPDLEFPTDLEPAHDNATFFVCSGLWENKPAAVYKFHFDGRLVATYRDKNFQGVGGLTVTRDGTLLVCHYAVPGCIHMLSPECRKMKEILRNVHIIAPWCVTYLDDTDKLFVFNNLPEGYTGRDKINSTMKVFQMR